MNSRPTALKRRIAPSVPLVLTARNNDGKEEKLELQLCLDADALCALEEKVPTLNTLSLNGLEIFCRMNMRILGAALWASALRHHPEYDTIDAAGRPTNDGLDAIRSFVDLGNAPEVTKALEAAYMATLSEEQKEWLKKLRESEPRAADPTSGAATPAPSSPGETSGPSADTTSASLTAKQGA